MRQTKAQSMTLDNNCEYSSLFSSCQ